MESHVAMTHRGEPPPLPPSPQPKELRRRSALGPGEDLQGTGRGQGRHPLLQRVPRMESASGCRSLGFGKMGVASQLGCPTVLAKERKQKQENTQKHVLAVGFH